MTSVAGPSRLDRYSDDDRLSPSLQDDLDVPLDRYEIFLPAVQSLVNALGGYEEISTKSGSFETIYRPGDSVLAVLKDLKRLWRKDDTDDERTVARCMAKAGLMKELLALVCECTDRGEWGRKVALVACDLIAALSWPIDVAQELKEMEDEPGIVTDYASLLRSQREYKAMILQSSRPLRCILALILPSLAKPRKDEKDERVISLGLHIVRNLLAIKDAVVEGTATGEKEELSYLQSTLIAQLNKLTYFQLILTLASCAKQSDFNQYNVLVLDILHLVFRSVKAKDLIQDQARIPMEKLAKLLEGEKKQNSLHSRVGMTRHSRFGTTVAVRAGDQRIVLHKQNAISANVGEILDATKKKKAGKLKRVDELTLAINLDADAMRVLQDVAKNFVTGCFNTFFASILSDIKMERSKIRPTDSLRTLYLARFFIEYLLLLRAKNETQSTNHDPDCNADTKANFNLPLGLVAEMAELESVRMVVGRMRIAMEERPPAWTEIQASLDCFTQILLLIDVMSSSTEDEDLEVAELLQHQLYYNGDVLDSALSVITGYKDQSVAYLDSIIHFAYVLLRMLERYSKTKTFMYVRKRKASRRKRKQAETGQAQNDIPEEYAADEEGGGDEPDRDAPSYAEHAFTFQSFEKANRFAQEAVVNTLISYLTRCQEFADPEQMKRVVGLMHRQVIKTQAEGLYFKVSALILFRRIMDERESLPKSDGSRDLIQLLSFILRKFFKKVADDPFVIVQALTAKTRGHWKELSSYKSDEDEDDEMGGQRSRILDKLLRGPAELEFKKNKGLSWSQQMGVVVAMLINADKQGWIEWILEVLELAHAARQDIVLAVDGPPQASGNGEEPDEEDEDRRVRNFGGPSDDAVDKFTQHDLLVDSDQRRKATTENAHFRLMLKLLAFDRTEDEMVSDQRWYLPPKVTPTDISTSIGALRSFLASPPSLSEDPKSLLRRKAKRKQRDPDASDEEEGRPRHQRKKKEETQIYKSAAFIEDSDDDEEADKAFFAREAELRRETQDLAERQGRAMESQERKKRKKGKGKSNGEDDLAGEVGRGMQVDKEVGDLTVRRREMEENSAGDEDREDLYLEVDGAARGTLGRRRLGSSGSGMSIDLDGGENGSESGGESDGGERLMQTRARLNGLSKRVVESDSD